MCLEVSQVFGAPRFSTDLVEVNEQFGTCPVHLRAVPWLSRGYLFCYSNTALLSVCVIYGGKRLIFQSDIHAWLNYVDKRHATVPARTRS